MKSYVIFYVEEVSDPSALKAYQAAAHPTLAEHGGKVIVAYGQQEMVEGSAIKGVVEIEFPSYDAARAWYHSDGYQQAKKLRDGGVRCHAVIVEAKG